MSVRIVRWSRNERADLCYRARRIVFPQKFTRIFISCDWPCDQKEYERNKIQNSTVKFLCYSDFAFICNHDRGYDFSRFKFFLSGQKGRGVAARASKRASEGGKEKEKEKEKERNRAQRKRRRENGERERGRVRRITRKRQSGKGREKQRSRASLRATKATELLRTSRDYSRLF